jgi:hypothetical protein
LKETFGSLELFWGYSVRFKILVVDNEAEDLEVTKMIFSFDVPTFGTFTCAKDLNQKNGLAKTAR